MTTLFRTLKNQDDFCKITNSINTCIRAHSGMKRKYTGLPYYNHPLRVALATATHGEAEVFWIMAALFHDVIEDWVATPYKSMEEAKEAIYCCSGQQTLDVVLELTNVKIMRDGKPIPRREQKLLDWERLSKVSRVAKIIKMYDRRDNLLDMSGARTDFLLKYTDESIELLRACGDADPNVAAELDAVISDIVKVPFTLN